MSSPDPLARFRRSLRDYSLQRARDSSGVVRRMFAQWARDDHRRHLRAKIANNNKGTTP